MNAKQVFTSVLKYTGILAAALLIVGGLVGFITTGANGLLSAFIGTAMAIIFAGITALSLIIAIKFDLAAFFGIVMGAWLVKAVLFVVLLVVLRDQPFVQPIVLYVTLVVAIVGTLTIDALVVYRSRISYVSDATLPPVNTSNDV